MEAILYICHGSRTEKGRKQAVRFVRSASTQISVSIQEVCFLELAEPDIIEGVRRCVEKGATRIILYPVFLLTAGHVKRDIPQIIEAAKQQFPSLELRIGQPFGVEDRMIAMLGECVSMQERNRTDSEQPADVILLVGRGSGDPEAIRDFEQISKRLFTYLSKQWRTIEVTPCYLAVAKPTFEDQVRWAEQSGYQNMIVIPYLLFSGVLTNTMEKVLHTPERRGRFSLYPTLSDHPRMSQIFCDRVMRQCDAVAGER